ncbi:uncharacterized protein LOC131936188 [Physella acuta]|uniref:uncharacterized protein LOC131936188 n=1 Tax=Physella acuta TaxID=109671 RepID=UPI0027DD58E1|nr:uncharacterized protein LOC131936188 [Physella acuta]
MNYCILYGLWMAILCFSKVKGQSSRNDIVSPSVAETGGTFTVTCDASRAGVPTTATTISSLRITHRRGTINSLLAFYRTLIPPYYNLIPPTSIPVRNWTLYFEGNQNNTGERPKNRNTMKMALVVHDPRCADAGTYICHGKYMLSDTDYEPELDGFYQNLSIKVGRKMSFYLNPMNNTGLGPFESVHRPGSSVTIYCSVEGPNNVTFKWIIGSNFSITSLYPALNPIFERVDIEPACSRYRYSSTLKFQIEYKYDGYMFMCVATENNRDTVVGNMAIYTQIGTEEAHTGQRISDQLISPSVAETGGTFTVTCDASRAGVPTTATTVRTLVIEWSDGTQQLKPLARYGHNGTQYEAKTSVILSSPNIAEDTDLIASGHAEREKEGTF